MDRRHRVAIIVDKNFCRDQLLLIARKMHVWLIESEKNLNNTNEFYSQHGSISKDNLGDGITLFNNEEKKLPDDVFLSILDEVAEHHNEYSHAPGWTELHVFGVSLNENIKDILRELDFTNFIETDCSSFIAKK